MDSSTIIISANPNNIVVAPVGSIFYRHNKDFFVIAPDGQNEKSIYFTGITNFSRTKYNVDFYKNYKLTYTHEWETWMKISGDGDVGWKFIAFKRPYVLQGELTSGSIPNGPTIQLSPEFDTLFMLFSQDSTYKLSDLTIVSGSNITVLYTLTMFTGALDSDIKSLSVNASASYRDSTSEEYYSDAIFFPESLQLQSPITSSEFFEDVGDGMIVNIAGQMISAIETGITPPPGWTDGWAMLKGTDSIFNDEAIPGDSIEFLSTLSIVDANNQVQEFSIGGAQLPVVNTPRIIYSSGSLADFFNSVGMSTNRYLYLCAYSSASYGEEDLIKGIDLNTDVSGSAVISQRYSLDLEQLSIGNISNDDLYQIANDAIGNQGKTFNSTEMNRLPVYVYLEGLGITSGYSVSYDVKQIPFIVSGELDESVEYVIKYDVPGHMGDAVACFKLHDTYLFNDINITLGELPAEGDLPQYEE